MSIYGEPATYLDEQVMWITGQPTSDVITMPVSPSADEEQRSKQADDLFAYYAGSHAEDLGFKRVVIRTDDGTRPGEIDIFGFKLTIRASIGTGPVTDLGEGIVYDRHADGVWFRGGFTPDAPFQAQNIALPTGATFALTYGIEDHPSGWFVYECLSCRAADAGSVLAKNIYPLLRSVRTSAERDHLNKVSVAIFGGPRKSTWQFPTLLHVIIVRRNGEWTAPKLSEQQVTRILAEYVRKMKARGAVLRREK
jgi:hypothetical protein